MTGTGAEPDPEREERLLTSADVAALFNVDLATVARWARDGNLTALRTPGGGRGRWRFRQSDVRALLRAGGPAANSEPDKL